MPAQALDAATRAEIARRLAAGESVSAVARDLGLDRGTVRKYAAPNIRPSDKPTSLPPEAGVPGVAGPCRVLPGRAGPLPTEPEPATSLPPAGRGPAAPGFVPKWLRDEYADLPELQVGCPDPAPEAGGPALPDPVSAEYAAYEACDPGPWGVLSDTHIPFHDRRTIERWAADCKRMGAVGLLLNGDTLDCHQISDHAKDPSAPRMKSEVEKGRQFLEWLRSEFPRARIVYKEGNHDDRLRRFLAARAPELYDLDDLHLPALLRASALGVEWVADKRSVMLGKLPALHGHEYQGGGGVMPARWLFLRTGDSAICGHFHQPSGYTFRTVRGREVGVWSTGCACYLSPAYRPLNQWAHGWAVVEVAADRGYHVHNRRLLRDGRVV